MDMVEDEKQDLEVLDCERHLSESSRGKETTLATQISRPKNHSSLSSHLILKGETWDVPDSLKKITFGIGWECQRGMDIFSALVGLSLENESHLLVDRDHTTVIAPDISPEALYYTEGDTKAPKASNGKVDCERFTIDLDQINSSQTCALIIGISIFTELESLHVVQSAYCRLVNQGNDKELAHCQVFGQRTANETTKGSLCSFDTRSTHNGMILLGLFRTDPSSTQWTITAPAFSGCFDEAQDFLRGATEVHQLYRLQQQSQRLPLEIKVTVQSIRAHSDDSGTVEPMIAPYCFIFKGSMEGSGEKEVYTTHKRVKEGASSPTGSTRTWNESFSIYPETSPTLMCRVIDKRTVFGSSTLGEVVLDLAQAEIKPGEENEMTLNLKDAEGILVGALSFKLEDISQGKEE